MYTFFQTNMGCFGAEGNTSKAEFLEWPLLPPHHSNAAPSSPGFIMTLPVLFLVNQGFDRKKIRMFYYFLNLWWHVFGRLLRVTWYLAGVAWTRWQPEERRFHCEGRSARVHLLCQPWKTAAWQCWLAAVEQVKRQRDQQVLRTVELRTAAVCF